MIVAGFILIGLILDMRGHRSIMKRLTLIALLLVALSGCARIQTAAYLARDGVVKVAITPPPDYIPFRETLVVKFVWYALPGH